MRGEPARLRASAGVATRPATWDVSCASKLIPTPIISGQGRSALPCPSRTARARGNAAYGFCGLRTSVGCCAAMCDTPRHTCTPSPCRRIVRATRRLVKPSGPWPCDALLTGSKSRSKRAIVSTLSQRVVRNRRHMICIAMRVARGYHVVLYKSTRLIRREDGRAAASGFDRTHPPGKGP
jgi:hypothetical protein